MYWPESVLLADRCSQGQDKKTSYIQSVLLNNMFVMLIASNMQGNFVIECK